MERNSSSNSTNFTTSLVRHIKRPGRRVKDYTVLRMDLPAEGSATRRVLLGNVYPVVTLLFVAMNVLMLFVFWKGKMRSPTHIILTAIAVADMVNGISFLIPAMHFYTFGNVRDYVTYEWCWPLFFLNGLLPNLAHSSSLFYTVLLALQQYINVKFPFKARSLCTKRNALMALSLLSFVIFLLDIADIYDKTTYFGINIPSRLLQNTTLYACARGRTRIGNNVVLWIKIIFFILFPVLALTILNLLLIRELKMTTKHIEKSLKLAGKSQMASRKKTNRRITLLTVLVVLSVLMTEFPGFISLLIIRYSDTISCRQCAMKMHRAIMRLVITIFYPSNFIIYCFISTKFRQTFYNLFSSVIQIFLPMSIIHKNKTDPTLDGEDDTGDDSNIKSTSL